MFDIDGALADMQQESGIADVIERNQGAESGAVSGTNESVIGTNESVIGTNESVIGTNESVIGTDTSVIGEQQFSIARTKDMLWQDQLKNPKRNDTFVVEKNTPSYLTERGVNNRPLAIPQSVVTKAKSGKDESHSISDVNISKLQSGIDNAIAVIDDKARNTITFITNLQENGKPIIATFVKDASFDGDTVHQGTSIHARQNIQAYISKFDSADITVLNQNEFDNLSRNGTHNDASVQESGKLTDDSISQTDAVVNPEAKENITDAKIDLERAKRDAERIIEWERKEAPTVDELNRVRGAVKDFDSLSGDRQRAIVRMVRSGKNIDEGVIRGVSNIMAITNKKGAVLAPDVEIRFAEFGKDSTRRGIKTEVGGKTVILLNANATYKDSIRGSIAHEIVHYLENRKGYKALADFAMKHAKAEKVAEVRETYAGVYEGENAEAKIEGEVVASVVAEMLGSEKFLKRYAQMGEEQGSVVKRIAKYVKGIANALKDKDDKASAVATDMMNLVDKALGSEVAREKTGEKFAVNTASKYDFKKSFSEQVEDYKNGVFPTNDALLIGSTPQIYKNIGFNALPMTINQTHVDYALNGTKNADHSLGEALLKQLPQALKDPIAVIASKTQNTTSVVAILSINHNGNQVTVPVFIDGISKQNGIRIDSNAVTSVYSRKNAISSLMIDALADEANGKVAVYYWDKKRAVALLPGGKVTMPNVLNTLSDGYVHSIREKGSPVKPKFENVTESQQFKRWFGDWEKHPNTASKVVNADGTPKIVYHGTNADFTTFGEIKSQPGYWFTESKEYAEQHGKKVLSVYLSAKNIVTENDLWDIAEECFGKSASEKDIFSAKFRDFLVAKKYDGIAFEHSGSMTYIVFNPEQIKSATDNIGTFDKSEPDIRYDLDPEAVKAQKKNNEKRSEKLEKENEELKEKLKKERSLREKMAREDANAAKAERAKRYTKKEVAPAVEEIEALTDEQVKSLAKGFALEGMSGAQKDRIISDIYIALHEASAEGEAGCYLNGFAILRLSYGGFIF